MNTADNEEHDEREKNLSELAPDTGHQFDQTNGMVDGLNGDADSPEEVERRTRNADGSEVLVAPVPGTQMPGGTIPVAVERDQNPADEDPDGPAR